MQKIPLNEKQSYYDYSQSVAKSVIEKLHKKDPYDVVSVLSISSEKTFTFFHSSDSISSKYRTLCSSPKPTEPICLQTPLVKALFAALKKAYRKYTDCQHIRLLVLTDGFRDLISPDEEEITLPPAVAEDVTCIIVNNSGNQVPSRLKTLESYFKDFHVIDNNCLGSCDELADSVLSISSCEIYSAAILAIGHLSAFVSLAPSPCIRHWSRLNIPKNEEYQIFVEIFGFLQINDMGHPPIVSCYTVVHSPDAERRGGEILKVLLDSLKRSHTSAIANIYVQPRVDSLSATVEPNKDRQFVTHGFISEFRGTGLRLSFFGEESKAVAWLGPFDYLASSADFEGHVVYDAAKNITPFPVGTLEKPSYVLPPSSSPPGTEFQYSSWINNANGPSADVNKIFRLCKKLPDKTDFFLKELVRVMSLAEVLGWTQLTQAIQTLLPTHLPQNLDADLVKRVYTAARLITK
ncbi:hypothetical protein Aperf_G00000108188 [Anoplocephala perfoliata]